MGQTVIPASFGFLASLVSVGQISASKCPTFHTRAVSKYLKSHMKFELNNLPILSKESIAEDIIRVDKILN